MHHENASCFALTLDCISCSTRYINEVMKLGTVQKTKLLLLLSATSVFLGACSKKEIDPISQIPPERAAQIYDRVTKEWDENRDGTATCADIAIRRRALFNIVDADKNGNLWPGEYRLAKFEDKSFLFFEFPVADTNDSSRIELTEFLAVPHSKFQGIDANSDCIISKEEALRSEVAAIRSGERRRPVGAGKPNNKRDEEDEILLPIPE